jgi:hypothetical protein
MKSRGVATDQKGHRHWMQATVLFATLLVASSGCRTASDSGGPPMLAPTKVSMTIIALGWRDRPVQGAEVFLLSRDGDRKSIGLTDQHGKAHFELEAQCDAAFLLVCHGKYGCSVDRNPSRWHAGTSQISVHKLGIPTQPRRRIKPGSLCEPGFVSLLVAESESGDLFDFSNVRVWAVLDNGQAQHLGDTLDQGFLCIDSNSWPAGVQVLLACPELSGFGCGAHDTSRFEGAPRAQELRLWIPQMILHDSGRRMEWLTYEECARQSQGGDSRRRGWWLPTMEHCGIDLHTKSSEVVESLGTRSVTPSLLGWRPRAGVPLGRQEVGSCRSGSGAVIW